MRDWSIPIYKTTMTTILRLCTDRRLHPQSELVLTEQEIVAGMRDGNRAAAEALVEQFGPGINRRVWRLLGADSEHNDIVQQVFAQIFDSLPKLKDPQALSDWIGIITVNVVRKELRRRRYRRIIKLAPQHLEAVIDPTCTEDKMLLRRGFDILDKMKIQERIVFIMRFLEGAEINEIAIATGSSPATTKRRIARARNVFQKKASRDPLLASLLQGGNEDEK